MRMYPIDKNLRTLWEHLGRDMSIEEADRILEEIFSELNKQKFGGALPQYKYLQVNLITGGLTARCTPSMGWITISPFVDPKDYRQKMAHEMTHHFVYGHGEDFQKRLVQVASGEPWFEKALAQYRYIDRRESLIREIFLAMEDLLKNEAPPSWIEARWVIMSRAGCTIRELFDAVPDCRELWASYLSKKGKQVHSR